MSALGHHAKSTMLIEIPWSRHWRPEFMGTSMSAVRRPFGRSLCLQWVASGRSPSYLWVSASSLLLSSDTPDPCLIPYHCQPVSKLLTVYNRY